MCFPSVDFMSLLKHWHYVPDSVVRQPRNWNFNIHCCENLEYFILKKQWFLLTSPTFYRRTLFIIQCTWKENTTEFVIAVILIDLNVGVFRIECRIGCQLLHKVSCGFLHSLYTSWRIVSRLGHDCILWNAFLFTIHWWSYHNTI